jgi:hypothetical protein
VSDKASIAAADETRRVHRTKRRVLSLEEDDLRIETQTPPKPRALLSKGNMKSIAPLRREAGLVEASCEVPDE